MNSAQTPVIAVERSPDLAHLETLGVFSWPIWTKEVSTFPWVYEATETCYFLEGEVVVTPDGGEPFVIGKGDLVTFPVGMGCTWEIRTAVKKHYSFS